jgi:SAM-dependent methyltransferase
MSQSRIRVAEVSEHYRKLAPEYESRSNKTCEQAYRSLLGRFLGGRSRVIELGSGATDLLDRLESPLSVAYDLSAAMLRMRRENRSVHKVVGACECLPFRDAQFNGAFSINVLEHVANPGLVLREAYRVLEEGGIFLIVTPNGNWEGLLDLAERWSLKIPEGPHEFLTSARLRKEAEQCFRILEHRTFLSLPVGPLPLAALVDTLSFCHSYGGGFFQYLVGEKVATASRSEVVWDQHGTRRDLTPSAGRAGGT